MKRYFLGLFAIVPAIVFSVFVTPQTFTQYNVTDESDTEYFIELGHGICSVGEKLCSFTADQSGLEGWQLKSTIDAVRQNSVFDRS